MTDAHEYTEAVYEELRALARQHMQRERVQHTLQPTALVHEAYLRLARANEQQWNDAAHFKAIASRAIRQVLIDHARGRDAAKRGGGRLRVTLDGSAAEAGLDEVDFVALDEALTELATLNPRQAQVVELRYFGGLKDAEIADHLDVSPRTVRSEWRFARAWLSTRL